MKTTLAALAAAALLMLTGCAAPSTPVQAAPVPEPVETVTEAQAVDFASSVCGVLDNLGVAAGVPMLFATAADNGIDAEQLAPLLAVAVTTMCPEHEPEIALMAAAL